jgi:hypothetical protein
MAFKDHLKLSFILILSLGSNDLYAGVKPLNAARGSIYVGSEHGFHLNKTANKYIVTEGFSINGEEVKNEYDMTPRYKALLEEIEEAEKKLEKLKVIKNPSKEIKAKMADLWLKISYKYSDKLLTQYGATARMKMIECFNQFLSESNPFLAETHISNIERLAQSDLYSFYLARKMDRVKSTAVTQNNFKRYYDPDHSEVDLSYPEASSRLRGWVKAE